MIDHTQRLIAIALMAAITGAVSSCHSEEAPQPAVPTAALPTPSLQASPRPLSLVGTVPVHHADERAVTPTETVGAASN